MQITGTLYLSFHADARNFTFRIETSLPFCSRIVLTNCARSCDYVLDYTGKWHLICYSMVHGLRYLFICQNGTLPSPAIISVNCWYMWRSSSLHIGGLGQMSLHFVSESHVSSHSYSSFSCLITFIQCLCVYQPENYHVYYCVRFLQMARKMTAL